MNKLITKISALALGLGLAVGVGVGVGNGSKKAEVANAVDQEITFSFSSAVSGWPTAATTAGPYTYTIDAKTYTFALGANVYFNNSYLMLKYTTYLGLPALSGYKLTKIIAGNSSGCSVSTHVGVSSSSSSASYVAGGSFQTWGSTSSTYTYNLTETEENTVYYLYITNKNCQIISLTLTYSKVSSECTHNWVAGTVHAPTCTETGYTEYECSLCHEEKQDDVVAALGHSYVNHVCDRCGAVEPDERTAGYIFSEHYSADTVIEDESISLDDVISIRFVKRSGGTDTKYYKSGTAVRWYGGGTLTISSNSGNIQSINIEYSGQHSNSVTADKGSYSDISSASGTGTWVGDSDAVVFTQSGTSGHNKISRLSVTYDNGGVGTFTITYLANAADAEGGMSPTTASAPQVASCGFTRDGYEFTRWNTQADGEGDDYAVGTTVAEDVTLYAIWQEYIEPIGANVTMTGISSASEATVNGHPAIKCGTGKAGGSMSLTLNVSGLSKIKFYVAGWKGESGKTISVTPSSGSVNPVKITTIADNGVANSSPFTLSSEEKTYKVEMTLTDVPVDATITLETSSGNERFVVWGATDLFAETFANEFNSNVSCNVAGTSEPVTTGDWSSFQALYNGLDAEEKAKLHDATFTVTGSGSSTVVTATGTTSHSVAEAMARYDYIVGKYNKGMHIATYNDFINRNPAEIGAGLAQISAGTNNNVDMIIVIAAFGVSTLFFATLCVVRKRKGLRK